MNKTEIKKFIKRFKGIDWNDGLCYYMALILSKRFDGRILYDVIYGHFVCDIHGILFDSKGEYKFKGNEQFVPWSQFMYYDKSQYERIVRDCINIH